jgi:S1-C subfamily serine protease
MRFRITRSLFAGLALTGLLAGPITLASAAGTAAKSPQKAGGFLGVHVQTLTAELKEHLELKADKGVLVAHVWPHSPAAKAGLKEEDVITQVAGGHP